LPYTSLNAPKSAMSAKNTVVFSLSLVVCKSISYVQNMVNKFSYIN
jgi:hypothetical protein